MNTASEIQIQVNGEARQCPSTYTIAELLASLEMKLQLLEDDLKEKVSTREEVTKELESLTLEISEKEKSLAEKKSMLDEAEASRLWICHTQQRSSSTKILMRIESKRSSFLKKRRKTGSERKRLKFKRI